MDEEKKWQKPVETQKVRKKRSKDASHGEHSPYWDDHDRNRGDQQEHVQANPDILPEVIDSPSTPQLIMGEAIEHLQGRQKEVYLLNMREDKSLVEVAEILSIDYETVKTYKERAVKFIQKYCQEAIKKGRV